VQRELAHQGVVVLAGGDPQRRGHGRQHDVGRCAGLLGRRLVGPVAPAVEEHVLDRVGTAHAQAEPDDLGGPDGVHAVVGRHRLEQLQSAAGRRAGVADPASRQDRVVVPDLDVDAVRTDLHRHLEGGVRVQHGVGAQLADRQLRLVDPVLLTGGQQQVAHEPPGSRDAARLRREGA
jgi:hypothetical protein